MGLGTWTDLCPSLLRTRAGGVVWGWRVRSGRRLRRRLRLVPARIRRTFRALVSRESRIFQSREHHEYAHYQRPHHQCVQQYVPAQRSRFFRWWRLWCAQQHPLCKYARAQRIHRGFAKHASELAAGGAQQHPRFAERTRQNDRRSFSRRAAESNRCARRGASCRHASVAQLFATDGQPGNGDEWWTRLGQRWRSSPQQWRLQRFQRTGNFPSGFSVILRCAWQRERAASSRRKFARLRSTRAELRRRRSIRPAIGSRL